MSKEDKEVKKKVANQEEHNAKTTLGCKFYSIAFLAAVGMIVLYTAITYLSGFGEFLSKFANKLIEYLAAGLLPAIVVAFVTDLANTKRQKKLYKAFYEDSIMELRSECIALSVELYYDAIEINPFADEPRTFAEWCKILYSAENDSMIKSFDAQVEVIAHEAKRALQRLYSYQGYRDNEKNKALENLCDSYAGYRTTVKRDGKSVETYISTAGSFSDAVLRVFPAELPENEEIKRFFTQEYDEHSFV